MLPFGTSTEATEGSDVFHGSGASATTWPAVSFAVAVTVTALPGGAQDSVDANADGHCGRRSDGAVRAAGYYQQLHEYPRRPLDRAAQSRKQRSS